MNAARNAAVSGDSLYAASWRPSFGAAAGEPVGHVVVRRLDDDVDAVLLPVRAGEDAAGLLSRVEVSLRGPATEFEDAWGIKDSTRADPGTEQGWIPEKYRPRDDARECDPGVVLTGADARVRFLPEPAAVFAADQPWLADNLHALVSVDAGTVAPGWRGRLPLLSPVEPEDGLLGEDTTPHHGRHTGVNWISFHVGDDGLLTFLGEREYFAEEGPAGPGPLRAGAATEFAAARVRWARCGYLVRGADDDPTRPAEGWAADDLVDQFGGEPGYGNWSDFPPPSAFRLDRSDPLSPVLRLADGRPFTFIAATPGYPWRPDGADAILLFAEPETRTVVYTFDWS